MTRALAYTLLALSLSVAGMSEPAEAQSAKLPTGVVVESSLNPVPAGQAVVVTAVVGLAVPGAATPGGSVEFFDGLTSLGTAALATAEGRQVASLTLDALAPGMHPISATYHGDDACLAAISAPVVQLVQP